MLEDTFEQYVEGVKVQLPLRICEPLEYGAGRAMLEDSDIILPGAIDFPQGTMTLEAPLARFEEPRCARLYRD